MVTYASSLWAFQTKKNNSRNGIFRKIEEIGEDITVFNLDDEVYGTTGINLGAHAEYLCISVKAALVKKPNEINHVQAAATMFGGLTAIHFLKDKADLKEGQKILINGASGAVGTASIQLAKYLGAHITGVCSIKNIDLIQSLGAVKVIDYTSTDLHKDTGEYDVILDTVGNLSLSNCKHLLKKQGKFIAINAGLVTNLSALFKKNLICGAAEESKENLKSLRKLVETGNMKPVIDKVYALDQIIKAHSHVDKGHKKGNVILSIKQS